MKRISCYFCRGVFPDPLPLLVALLLLLLVMVCVFPPLAGAQNSQKFKRLEVTERLIFTDPLTTAERNALTNVAEFTVVPNTTTSRLELYVGSSWQGLGDGATELSELSDVNTSTPTSGYVLIADGVDWESRALTMADISDLGSYLSDDLSDYTEDSSPTAASDYVLFLDADESGGTWNKVKLEDLPGGGGMGPVIERFRAGELEALESNFAPLEVVDEGTAVMTVAAFDDTTQEFRNGTFQVPADIDSSGTVTFRAYVYAKTAAASKNVELTFDHRAVADGEAVDGSYTSEVSADTAIDATQDDVTLVEWTETVSNLGWTAEDLVLFRVSRTEPSADDLGGDLYLVNFTVEIPRD